MSKATILVTGATGFTGGHLARRLAADGHSVRALVRDPLRATGLEAAGIELAVGDITDPGSLTTAMAGIELVYHIAAVFRQENVSEARMWATNAGGVSNMIDAAVAAGTVRRFVHCSTIGVHGDIKHPPADEEAPFAPGDHYQESKAEGERIAHAAMSEGRLPITIFRPGGIYGPGDTRFLKLFRPISKGRFVMIGSGKTLYQLVYIDDLVDGIILCGTIPRAVGNVYILTGEPALPLNDLVKEIAGAVGREVRRWRVPFWPVYWVGFACEMGCKTLGLEPPLYRRRVDFFRKDRSFTIAKARREIGYAPGIDVATGLRRTAEWYRDQRLIK